MQQIFAVGDVGALTEGQVRLYERFWQLHASKEDLLVLLGDNLYPAGYRGTLRDKKRWERVVRMTRVFPGRVCATPGNHDWKAGEQGLLHQATFIPHYPSVGLVGPETLFWNSWRLIFVDSELYMRQTQKHYSVWEKVDSLGKVESLATIFVLHHPPLTAGVHGGNYPLILHIFPLLSFRSCLYLPLPGVGSMISWLRKKAKHPTDKFHPVYAALAESLLTRAKKWSGSVLFLSGHDHNLQFHWLGEKKGVIVSGSGCRWAPVARKKAFWARAVVGLWKISNTSVEAYALKRPQKPIWKYQFFVVP
ncbi:MAG: metallophosphoesterase [Bacteroidia bacterium]|nr:metallophosphoesterase [Bacteroidia bacterium]